jgi:hypothetical protein
MGGFYGHMSHLYDNPNLKFSQMMDIFKKAADGELEGTEKTDGQNLYVAYNTAEGKAKAVRNKSNISGYYREKNEETGKTELVKKHEPGGMDAAAIAKTFAKRGSVEKAFVEAFESFEAIARSFPKEKQTQIFGDGVNSIVFYSAEIQDPKNPNVVNYDSRVFNIHRVEPAVVDIKTGKALEDSDIKGNVQELGKVLNQVQKMTGDQKFKVQVNAIRQLEGLSDGDQLDRYLERLNNVISDAGISDEQTVGEYLIARLLPMISNQVSLTPEKEDLIIKKMLGVKGINTREIKKDLNPTQVEAINMLLGNSKALVQNAIQPLEDIVHDFSVEMIKNLESVFVLDRGKEVARLRKELRTAKLAIEKSGHDAAIEILKKQMGKIKDIEKNISTAAEGFVFDYDGHTYKLTGNFAPMNQLLGLFKYGRGKIPAMQKLSENDDKEIIAIYPGRFQPMGQHHLATYENIIKKHGVDNTFIATSNVVDPSGSPLNFKEKKQVMLKHGIPGNQIVQIKNPYNAKELISRWDPSEIEVVYYVGSKDMDRIKKPGGITKDGYRWHLALADHVSLDIPGFGEMCGTTCRSALAGDDKQKFADVMGFFDEDIFNLFREKFSSNALNEEVESVPLGIFLGLIEEAINEVTSEKQRRWACAHAGDNFKGNRELTKKQAKEMCASEIEEELFTEEELEEMSSMAGGSVSGYSLPLGAKPPHKKNKKRTYEQMDRIEVYEEIRLRNLVREGIKKISQKITKEEEQNLLEETRLRSLIRKLILAEGTSTGDSDPAPHQSTGINFLEELLKQIVPILEQSYKRLTTSEDQRRSFREHILKAIEDTIVPLQVTDQVDLQEQFEEEEDITVNIEDDPDFIDIRSDKEIESDEKEENGDPTSSEEEVEQFAIEGEDVVGRNSAFETFKSISNQIIGTYEELSGSPEDQKLFYQYLLTNIKLYFDKFENDISPSVTEPESIDYGSSQLDTGGEEITPSSETMGQEQELGLGA